MGSRMRMRQGRLGAASFGAQLQGAPAPGDRLSHEEVPPGDGVHSPPGGPSHAPPVRVGCLAADG